MDYTQELTPAVIYARYSSSGQREESIEGQIREGKTKDAFAALEEMRRKHGLPRKR